jgi:hypothetical protein
MHGTRSLRDITREFGPITTLRVRTSQCTHEPYINFQESHTESAVVTVVSSGKIGVHRIVSGCEGHCSECRSMKRTNQKAYLPSVPITIAPT